MFRLVLLVIFAAGTYAVPLVALPGPRIVGGSDAAIREAPYQVALLFDFPSSGIFSIACGGTIITPSVILSAAQCTYGSLASKWRIRAGSSLHNSQGQVIQVASFRQHEGYNPRTMENDIVVLFLATNINLGLDAAPVFLPFAGLEYTEGTDSLITGWGKTAAGGSTPVTLQKVTVQLIKQDICKSAYYGILPITDTMVCAGRHGIGGADACQGDTGGPMVISYILYGIASWGIGCGEPQYPGVYTKVPMFREWIDNNVPDTISAVHDLK